MFPAYAGMIRHSGTLELEFTSVPRLRGDDPSYETAQAEAYKCSPPTRG